MCLHEYLHNGSISLYADDTEFYNSSSDSGVLIAKTNEDLENVNRAVDDG